MQRHWPLHRAFAGRLRGLGLRSLAVGRMPSYYVASVGGLVVFRYYKRHRFRPACASRQERLFCRKEKHTHGTLRSSARQYRSVNRKENG